MNPNAIFAAMRSINLSYLKKALDVKQANDNADNRVGIYVVPLGYNLDGLMVYGARILGKSDGQPYVGAHYHTAAEYYYFPTGGGELNIGTLNGGEVAWADPIAVTDGFAYTIDAYHVHSARNLEDGSWDFIFAGDPKDMIDHDKDPEGDRYTVEEFKNPVPPHYPQAA